jgi:hypothetical protein
MKGIFRALFVSGLRFNEPVGQCRVSEDYRLPGIFSLVMGLFAGYILFFRPDIHGEVTPLIWIFRVLFPFGFGLAGLGMLGYRVITEFDSKRGEWCWTKTAFFRSTTRRGPLGEVRRLVLDAQEEESPGHGDSGSAYWRWKITLSMDIRGEVLPLTSWTKKIEGNRPRNAAVVEARDQAARLAEIIGCAMTDSRGQDLSSLPS